MTASTSTNNHNKRKLEDASSSHYQHHNGNWSDYIGSKRAKLEHQFRSNVANMQEHPQQQSQLFAQHSIWINGRTEPPTAELRAMIVANGGMTHNTLTRHTTVIVADHLPVTKLKQYRRQQQSHGRNLAIVTPQWIVQCVRAQQLLNTAEFALMPTSESHHPVDAQVPYDHDTSEPTEAAAAETEEQHTSLQLQQIMGARSTLTDPNFVENYFKSSRLHLLGSFKQIYDEMLPEWRQIVPRYDTLSWRRRRTHNHHHRHIIHIDMDCYFVSVALRHCAPQLKHEPCVVCHGSNNTTTTSSSSSTSEISSANYAARSFGINAGMFLGTALKRCPSLTVLPYQFADSVAISKQMYAVFFSFTNLVQYKSIDEALLELPGDIDEDVVAVAQAIRAEIFARTQCTASAGIAHNILLARMATRAAKPDGVHRFVHSNGTELESVMDEMKIGALPGVGRTLQHKFQEQFGIATIGDLRRHRTLSERSALQREFGRKQGEKLYAYLQGDDDRELHVESVRKSMGVEIGWGVRFTCESQLHLFVRDLSAELCRRMQRVHAALRAKQVCVRVKCKHPDAPAEPHKFLGHGWCTTSTKSSALATLTNDAAVIADACCTLLTRELRVDASVVRAVGIQVSKLNHDQIMGMNEGNNSSVGDSRQSRLQSMFAMKQPPQPQRVRHNIAPPAAAAALPAYSQIDRSVFDSLPAHIQHELRAAYKQQGVAVEAAEKAQSNKHKNKKNARKDKQVEVDDNDDTALFANESFAEFRPHLLAWLQHESSPTEMHQRLLCAFIDDCIEGGRLENVALLLKYLLRFANQRNNARWLEIYSNIVALTQRKMIEKYECELKL